MVQLYVVSYEIYMKLLWRLEKEAIKYKNLYIIAILSTFALTFVNLAAPKILSSITAIVELGMFEDGLRRAGRALDRAYAVLLAGSEDDDITNYFINTAFPTYREMDGIIKLLEMYDGMTMGEIMNKIDISYGRLENSIKFLLVNGDIYKEKTKGAMKYYKSISLWAPDMAYSENISKTRRYELKRMNDFINTKECYMKFTAYELNDETAHDCGRCSNCMGKPIFPEKPTHKNILRAIKFLKMNYYTIIPRKKWPSSVKIDNRNKILDSYLCQIGIALSSYRDAGWGRIVKQNKYEDNYFSDDLVKASSEILDKYISDNDISWVFYIDVAAVSEEYDHIYSEFKMK